MSEVRNALHVDVKPDILDRLRKRKKLDTNVLSELSRNRPGPRVAVWVGVRTEVPASAGTRPPKVRPGTLRKEES